MLVPPSEVPLTLGGSCRYAQAGTPQVTLDSSYNSSDHTLSITATQQTPATPGQEKKVPVLVPIRIALLASSGNALPLHTKVIFSFAPAAKAMLYSHPLRINGYQKMHDPAEDFMSP